ncbi:hypothetical protein [Leptolyngbya sp. PCC 6406]|uniref:hypothetical protein n=1 Tax=Leptolyngbya sp. PCC 6406 TaxID=1173264 RepID=UPI0003115104|nr:hypothetical protein [Leptolyngbya sp. PCC 6406]
MVAQEEHQYRVAIAYMATALVAYTTLGDEAQMEELRRPPWQSPDYAALAARTFIKNPLSMPAP